MAWIAFFGGFWIGVFVAVFIIGLCVAAREAEDQANMQGQKHKKSVM